MNKKEISEKIKLKAVELGFESCGISKAEEITDQKDNYTNWLQKNLHASMQYLERNQNKRFDPTILEPGIKSIISVLYNYYPKDIQKETSPRISKYAYGTDYHFVLKDKLRELLNYIHANLAPCSGRVFTDSAPVLERAWAARCGLGWIGKNTCLIVPGKGSYFFIGEILIDIELKYDIPIEDFCGSCTKCLNACPTNALVAPFVLDSNRCISYHTIENRDEIPVKFKGKFQNWIFGCDICQDVCPWNTKVESTHNQELAPKKEILEMTREDWNSLSEEEFRKLFKKTALMRTKYYGMMRNLKFIN